jgi:GxxExxY protein
MSGSDLSNALSRILVCAGAVGDQLRPGQALSQYEAVLERTMRESKLQFARQYPIGVPFDGPRDRGFRADFIVEGRVLLELAHMQALDAEQTDLALNYLRESGADLCLLINFGRTPVQIRRILPSGRWSEERISSEDPAGPSQPGPE